MSKIHVSSSKLFDQTEHTTALNEKGELEWKTSIRKWVEDPDEGEYARMELYNEGELTYEIDLSKNDLVSLLVHLQYIEAQENPTEYSSGVILGPAERRR